MRGKRWTSCTHAQQYKHTSAGNLMHQQLLSGVAVTPSCCFSHPGGLACTQHAAAVATPGFSQAHVKRFQWRHTDPPTPHSPTLTPHHPCTLLYTTPGPLLPSATVHTPGALPLSAIIGLHTPGPLPLLCQRVHTCSCGCLGKTFPTVNTALPISPSPPTLLPQ
jgi:hypothetical protein